MFFQKPTSLFLDLIVRHRLNTEVKMLTHVNMNVFTPHSTPAQLKLLAALVRQALSSGSFGVFHKWCYPGARWMVYFIEQPKLKNHDDCG